MPRSEPVTYHDRLKEAIQKTHDCTAFWVESVKVTEEFEGEKAWEGQVEVFALAGHGKAGLAYAWSYREGKEDKNTIVLGVPPVYSPEMAVKVAIASKGRK